MTKKSTKPKKPTELQARWLRRIALHPMVVTLKSGVLPKYSLMNGDEIDERMAQTFIKNGWVVGQRDSLPWFEDRPQTYRVVSVTSKEDYEAE